MKCCCEPRKLSQRINDLILHYSSLGCEPCRSSDASRYLRLPPPGIRRFRPLLSSTRRQPERAAPCGWGGLRRRASHSSSRSPSPPLPPPPTAQSTPKRGCACSRSRSRSRSSSGSPCSAASSITSIPPPSLTAKRLSTPRLPAASEFCLREPLLSAIRARAAGSRTCTVCGSPVCRKRRRVVFSPSTTYGLPRRPPLRATSSMADSCTCRPRITRPAMATLGGPGGRPWDSVVARPDLTYRATATGGNYIRPTWAPRRLFPRPPPPPPPPAPAQANSCNCPECVMDSTSNSRTMDSTYNNSRTY